MSATPVQTDRTHGALWASAVLLGALVIVQAGRSTGAAPAPAFADLVAQGGEFIALAVDGGNEDVLVVLDQRSEELLVYQPHNRSSMEFKSRESLKDLFFVARRGSGMPGPTGAPPPGKSPGNVPR